MFVCLVLDSSASPGFSHSKLLLLFLDSLEQHGPTELGARRTMSYNLCCYGDQLMYQLLFSKFILLKYS